MAPPLTHTPGSGPLLPSNLWSLIPFHDTWPRPPGEWLGQIPRDEDAPRAPGRPCHGKDVQPEPTDSPWDAADAGGVRKADPDRAAPLRRDDASLAQTNAPEIHDAPCFLSAPGRAELPNWPNGHGD